MSIQKLEFITYCGTEKRIELEAGASHLIF